MTTEQRIEAIKEAIEKAKNHQSKMDHVAWSVPALSSLKIRHLMNNLGAISTRYFEAGVHRGGLFSSTIRNNNLLSAVSNDNFASDEVEGNDRIQPVFLQNVQRCLPEQTEFLNIWSDTFEVEPESVGVFGPIDLYLFDGDHSYESQRKAMTHFLPAMADEFIVCVDDWQYGDVKNGTMDGIAESGCEILFQETLLNGHPYSEDEHRNMEWWRGFYVALLKKK